MKSEISTLVASDESEMLALLGLGELAAVHGNEGREGADHGHARGARSNWSARTPYEGADTVEDAEPAPQRRGPCPLPKWRLKRVVTYVDEHLGDHITLKDLADAAGLTRMYFAAQFRVAQGIRPHDYILMRRVARSQELLALPQAKIAEIAIQVGFQTQAHFTTVFKRFVGEPPHRWRMTALRAAQLQRRDLQHH